VQCAHAHIEIFTRAKFFDDHFCKKTYNIENSATLTKVLGECLEIKVTAGKTWGGTWVSTGQTLNTNPDRYVAVRSLDWSGVTRIDIKIRKASVVLVQQAFFSAGLHILDLYALAGADFDYDEIEVRFDGNPDDYGKLDYISTSARSDMLPLDVNDLVGLVEIHDVPLSRGVPTASFSLENGGGAYNTKIADNDAIIIWLARGAASYALADKVFGGRIQKVGFDDKVYGSYHRTIYAESHVAELIRSVDLFTATYVLTNGRTIIETALALALYCARDPDDANWFDAGGASGVTDDRINSLHSVEYTEKKLITPIREILEKATNPASVIGFDIRVKPSGVLIGHLKNSTDFRYSAIVYPERFKADSDAHNIINEQTVYGAKEKSVPEEEENDYWTDGNEDIEFNQGSQFITTQTSYQLAATQAIPNVGNSKFWVNQVKLDVVATPGETGKYKITYQKEGGAETIIVTDQAFTDIAWATKTHSCDVKGDAGKDLTVRYYLLSVGGAQVATRNHKTRGDAFNADWNATPARGDIFVDGVDKQFGDVSIRLYGSALTWIGADLYLPASEYVNCDLYPFLSFWEKGDAAWSNLFVVLEDSDGTQVAMWLGSSAEWKKIQLDVGVGKRDGWSGGLSPAFDWTQVATIRINPFPPSGTGTGNVRFDKLCFTGRPFSKTEINAASQATYGRAIAEPETDINLKSDLECELVAKSIISRFKDPLGAVESVVTDGSVAFYAADGVRIIVTNDLVDAWLEMREIVHTCQNGGQWNAQLILVADPVVHDYLIRKAFTEIQKIKRNLD
jgi:hypothetical protein